MVEGRKKALISGGIILLAVFAAYIFVLSEEAVFILRCFHIFAASFI